MSRLPLQTLPAFQVVARRPNLRAAAQTLHLTHSAVSQQIKQLEEQLGFALFDRQGRRLVLNEAGLVLQAAADEALERLRQGRLAAAAVASGQARTLRLAVLPSFAQRWLLPRIGRWQARHPDIPIEVEASQRLVDLQREGFDAALRQGSGSWPGLQVERLIDAPLIAVGAPAAAARLKGRGIASLADERLLGTAEVWARWFALDGCRVTIQPVANFNDAGLMLQAAEQDIGIALARELLADDALADGRLVRLSPLALPDNTTQAYWLAYPPEQAERPALVALREWLRDEMAQTSPATHPKAPVKPARSGRVAARR